MFKAINETVKATINGVYLTVCLVYSFNFLLRNYPKIGTNTNTLAYPSPILPLTPINHILFSYTIAYFDYQQIWITYTSPDDIMCRLMQKCVFVQNINVTPKKTLQIIFVFMTFLLSSGHPVHLQIICLWKETNS